MNIKELVSILNNFDNYMLNDDNTDGRINSLTSEDRLIEIMSINLESFVERLY